MKKLFLISLLIFSAAACSSGPGDLFPATAGSFKLKEAPQPFGKEFRATYESGDGKAVHCRGINASSGEEAYKYAGENRTPDITRTPSQKMLGLIDKSTWSLTWSEGNKGYSCAVEDANAQKILEDFDKNWPVAK
jgi:hypothetical protein